MRTLPLVAVVALQALLSVGCATSETSSDSSAELTGTVTVSAASSLKEAFSELADDFTAAHPKVKVRLNFDSSTTLANQIVEGAPADVFASADEDNMTRLVDQGFIARPPVVFARNRMVIVTKPQNPTRIGNPSDLADAGVVALCAIEAPCGRYTKEVLDKSGVDIPESNITRGRNVAATITAVSKGDAVAAIVYASDARIAGGSVEVIPISPELNVVISYYIGVLKDSKHQQAARAFESYVLREKTRTLLTDIGFMAST